MSLTVVTDQKAFFDSKKGELDLLQHFAQNDTTHSIEEVIEAIEESFISRRYSIRFVIDL